MSESLHDKHVGQIDEISEDLRKVAGKLRLLADMQGVTAEQQRLIDSLVRGLGGVRGGELGQLRLAFGLDEDIAAMNRRLRR